MTLTPKPTVQLVDVTKLIPWDRNPRTITVDRFEALKRHLEAEPEMLRARPLIVLPTGRCVAGNMRQRAGAALVEEGSERFLAAYPKGRVPTFVVDLDEARATQWALRDNVGYGEDDEQLLAELLYELEQAGQDLDLTGLEDRVRTQLLDSVSGAKSPHNFPDDPAPDPPAKPKSKPGKVYELGAHRLMCGDSTRPEHVERLLDGAKPKLMVTDPPYGVNLDLAWRADFATVVNRNKGKATSGNRTERAGPEGYDTKTIGEDVRVDWAEAYELVPSLQVAYVWFADKFIAEVSAGLQRIGFTPVQLVIWDKLQFVLSRSYYHWQHETALYVARLAAEGKSSDVPWYGDSHVPGIFAKRKDAKVPWLGSHDQSTVWQAPSPKRRHPDGEDPVDHPTQKPTLLYTRPYTNHTTRGAAVYEPFGGSGTAIIAAEMTGRRCYSMELDPAFCDVIRTRYAEFVGDDKLAP